MHEQARSDDEWISGGTHPATACFADAELVALEDRRYSLEEEIRLLEEENCALAAENCRLKQALERQPKEGTGWVAISRARSGRKPKSLKADASTPDNAAGTNTAGVPEAPRPEPPPQLHIKHAAVRRVVEHGPREVNPAITTAEEIERGKDDRAVPSYAAVARGRTETKTEHDTPDVKTLVEWWSTQ